MRQAVITRHGGPDVIQMRDAPDPTPGEGEVRIRVRASGVAFEDVLVRLGLHPDATKVPMVAGSEVAGIVDAVGAGVTRPVVGERVVALTRFGGYSELVVAPAALVYPAPNELSDTDIAAFPLSFITGIIALYRIANLTAGETVLVHGAGGGVGIAATQLARLRRARIIGTASFHKHDALRDFGADTLIDSRTMNVEREVKRLTGGRGADVILDPIGGRSFAASYRMLAPLGRLVMFGASSLVKGERRRPMRALRELFRMPRFSPPRLIEQSRGVFGLSVGSLWNNLPQLASAMEALIPEFESQRLKPVVARTFPLEHAAEAHRFLQRRANIGKVVLTTSI